MPFDLALAFLGRKLNNEVKELAYYNYKLQNPMTADREGVSVFYKDEGGHVFHAYSTYTRGIDMMNITYQFPDLVPMGRQDDRGLRHRDQYVPKI